MKLFRIFQALTGLAVLEGLLALGFYFNTPSSAENTLVAGYSTARLLGDVGLVIVLMFFLVLFAASFAQEEKLKAWATRLKGMLDSDIYRLLLATPVFFALAINLLGLCIYFVPTMHWALPFIKTYALVIVIGERIQVAQLWVVLILIKVVAFYFLSGGRYETSRKQISGLARTTIISWSLTVWVLALSVIWGLVARDLRLQLNNGPTFKLPALSIWFSLWALLERKNNSHFQHYRLYFWLGTV